MGGRRRSVRWLHYYWLIFLRKVKQIVRSNCTSHSIALGAAVGFFIGWQPVVGSQTVAALLLATLLRANRPATLLPVWVTNPATIVPIYGFNYWVGYLIFGWGPGLEQYKKALHEMVASDQGGLWDGVVNGFKALISFGPGAFASLLLGSVIVGLVVAVISYFPTLYVVNFVRAQRAKRRSQRHERVQRFLSDRMNVRDLRD